MEIIINDLSYKNLSNLTFTIHEGVITGFTGEGKSTILRLLNGILEGRGKVIYNGERPTKKTKLKVIKEIGYIGSNFTNPYMATTVEEHIMFFIQYHKLSIKDPNKKALKPLSENTFKFPFFTIENVDIVDDKHIIVGNDNNLPFSSSRDPNQADDNEMILLNVESFLKAKQ
jgi:ABC-type sugar transport system ATPase subunit